MQAGYKNNWEPYVNLVVRIVSRAICTNVKRLNFFCELAGVGIYEVLPWQRPFKTN